MLFIPLCFLFPLPSLSSVPQLDFVSCLSWEGLEIVQGKGKKEQGSSETIKKEKEGRKYMGFVGMCFLPSLLFSF